MTRRTDMPTWMRLLLVPVLAAGWLATAAAPAHADCVSPPVKSAHAFKGVVTSTERDGLVAHVTADDGRKVVVNGSESDTGVTSVDRAYTVGARYVFHPLNDSSPYQDNACTATRELSGGAPMRVAGDDSSEEGAFSVTGWASGGTLAAGVALALALVAGGVLASTRRRRAE